MHHTTITLRRLFIAAALLLACGTASAIDLLPRLGVQAGYYSVEGAGVSDSATFGPTFGLTMSSGDNLFADLNLETLPVDVIGQRFTMSRGWRTELSGTVGYRIFDGVVLIGGYRSSLYGESLGSAKLGDNSGPFAGVNFPELRLGSSNRDILSLSIAVQQTTFTDKVNHVEQDSDVGVNIRLGYRRAGSPHSFGLRYQSFGSPSYQEYLSTLQYSYVFSRF
jgi:hypothetical protein